MRAREILDEIEVGGEVDSDHLYLLRHDNDFEPKQLTMFGVSAEPSLPKGMELVGRLGDMYIAKEVTRVSYDKHMSSYYYLFDNGKLLAYIVLVPADAPAGEYSRRVCCDELKGTGARVVTVYFEDELRGTGAAVNLYHWLLVNECDYIHPDLLQTRGGVKLWKKLISDSRMEAWIFNSERYEFYPVKKGAVWSNIYKDYRNNLIPFLTLKGKGEHLIWGDDE